MTAPRLKSLREIFEYKTGEINPIFKNCSPSHHLDTDVTRDVTHVTGRVPVALYPLFLGRFQWNFQIIICSCPSTDVPRFVEKYPKIKYAISDRQQLTKPLWNIFFITEWIALKLKILTDIKIIFKKKQLFHNRPSSFCSRYPNMCDRTKKWTIILLHFFSIKHWTGYYMYVQKFNMRNVTWDIAEQAKTLISYIAELREMQPKASQRMTFC
jgi:hypothetical protein